LNHIGSCDQFREVQRGFYQLSDLSFILQIFRKLLNPENKTEFLHTADPRLKRSGISSMTMAFYLWSAKLCSAVLVAIPTTFTKVRGALKAVEFFRMQNSQEE
jgi:hypothetical protein